MINLKKLIRKFEKNSNFYESADYDETSTRVDFLNDFFSIFGWDVNNDKLLPENYREVIHEATVLVMEDNLKKSKKPDYQFQVNGKPVFFVEAKKPSIDILKSKDSAFQLRRYGWSAGLEYSILTNFKTLVVYDCTVKPSREDDVSVARVAMFSFDEYDTKFNILLNYLSKDRVIQNQFDFEKNREFSDFDNYFLDQIREWRYSLAKNILLKSPKITESELNIFVQRFINKCLFLRICEDNNLESYKQLSNVKSLDSLKVKFEKADKKYNSGLFHYIEDFDYDIDFVVINQIFTSLYYPYSPYDFSVIPSSILAKVYDVFLSERIVIEKDKISIEVKPESRDFLGAVTTPENITNKIVNDSIEIRLKLGNVDFSDFRIADICCGSGLFLVSAFERIQKLYFEYAIRDLNQSFADNLIIGSAGHYKLSFKAKKDLLVNCIYGVDIDPSAIEVCKFSLLISCLEGLTPEEIYFINEESILPNLDTNIIFGNSLVDEKFYEFYREEDENLFLKTLNKVSPLSSDEFSEKNKSFDLIIGNPPYIRVQKLKAFSPDEYGYYKSNFSNYYLSNISSLDKYALFIERGMRLLKDNEGVLGFILPNRFIHEKNLNVLRRYLLQHEFLYRIINYNEIQLFSNVSTYSCLLYLSKSSNSKMEYISITEKVDEPIMMQEQRTEYYSLARLTDKPWQLFSKKTRELVDGLDDTFVQLKDLVDINVGLQTSQDSFYIIESVKDNKDYVYFKDGSEEQRIEKAILRPLIHKVSLQKYSTISPNKYIIYPYKKSENKVVLIQLDEIKKKFPDAYQYFIKHKALLERRNIQPLTNLSEEWHKYGRSQSVSNFESGERIIWSVLSLKSNFVYSKDPIFFTGGGNGPYYGFKMKDNDYSILYIQAILNSPFISKLIEESSIYFGGGYFSFGKQYIQDIPIKSIDFTDLKEKQIHDEIVRIMRELISSTSKLESVVSQIEKKQIERLIDAKEKLLNSKLAQLYGIENE